MALLRTSSFLEIFQLLQTGMELTEENVYRFRNHGYNVQEDGVYMTLDAYRRQKEDAERFARASRHGWEWAAAHPEETLDIVMEYVRRDHIATNRVLQSLMLDEILRLQFDRESGEREFRLRPDMVDQANKLMTRCGMLKNPVTYEELIAR